MAFTDYTLQADGWIKITWSKVVEKLGSEPAKGYVRVLDGTTRYTCHD